MWDDDHDYVGNEEADSSALIQNTEATAHIAFTVPSVSRAQ